MSTSLTIRTSLTEPSLNLKGCCIATRTTMNIFLMRLRNHLYLNIFFSRTMEILSRTEGFFLYGNLGVDFFSISELLYINTIFRVRLTRPIPLFYIIRTTSTLVLELLVVHFTFIVLLSRMIIMGKRNKWTFLYMILWNTFFGNSMKEFHTSCQKKKHLKREIIFNKATVCLFAIAVKKTLFSLDCTLKIPSGINN